MSLNLDEIKKELSPWVKESLKKENIKIEKLEITGTSEKGDNYLGDIIFLDVRGRDNFGKDKLLHLVIKKGKNSQILREEWHIKQFYQRENALYDEVFPAFKKFQLEKNVKEIFDSVPKCYATLDKEETQAILLEDLKKNGFELHDRFVNMNLNHIKFVLYNYAKFHAISFAMRDQQKELFDKLSNGFISVFLRVVETDNMKKWYDEQLVNTFEFLSEENPDIAEKLKQKTKIGLTNLMLEIGYDRVEDCIITHGDCWNNNFMFKYEINDRETPSKLAILDWQLSAVHSPVLDLSYFLYIVSSQKEVDKFDDLLHYYHDNLCANIREMGSDPEKLFPYTKLVEHWEKYSCYGITSLITGLAGMTCIKENAISFDDFDNTMKALDAWTDMKPVNYELYKERMFANIKHYCEGLKMSS